MLSLADALYQLQERITRTVPLTLKEGIQRDKIIITNENRM